MILKFLKNSIIASSIVANIFCSVFANEYSQELQDAYKWAFSYGITTQSTINSANLDGVITRAQMAKMISNYAINVFGLKEDETRSCSFPDENIINPSLLPYAKKACVLGLMGESGKDFRPGDSVTRAQFGTILSRMLWGKKYEASGEEYYLNHLYALKETGIIKNIDNPKARIEKRGNVMLMLMRSQNIPGDGSKTVTSSNKKDNTANSSNNTNKINTNEKYLTEDEVKTIIEKEEGLKIGSLESVGYTCGGDKCIYEFRCSVNGKDYYYSRENTLTAKTRKIQDLGIENAESIALKDANVSKNDAQIKHSYSPESYNITITTSEHVYIYNVSLDGKINKKKTLITEKNAVEIILKEVKLESKLDKVLNENKEICSLNFEDRYRCSFKHGGKQYSASINAENGAFIPTKKVSGGYVSGTSVEGMENVTISEGYKYIDNETAKEILEKKYNIKDGNGSMLRMVGEGKNAIYIYSIFGGSETEYYIDALNGTTTYSKDEIITNIEKDSGVSKSVIKQGKESVDDAESILEYCYADEKTQEVYILFSFISNGLQYTYKVSAIDGKIIDSKKDSYMDMGKVVLLAKQQILEKYPVKLDDEYQTHTWYRAYIWYTSNRENMGLNLPNEPEYVICYTDEEDKNIYRVILKTDGSIISIDTMAVADLDSDFLSYGLYIAGYDLKDFENKDINISGGFSF